MADSLDDIDFFTQPPFANPQLRTQAINRFHTVVDHFQACEPTQFTNDNYNRPALIRYTWEYASSESQDRFLWAFFHWLRLGMADGDDMTLDDDLRSRLYAFAEDLMNNFFIPLRAVGNQPTPQLSPLSEEEKWGHMGTPQQLSTLRSTCLVRDRHRCVVTRAFDHKEVCNRKGRKNPARDDGVEVIPRDDDGNELTPDEDFARLRVAHILPHSLTKQIDERGAVDVLDMLDIGIVDYMDGNIDQPHNAMSMTPDMHTYFGEFKVVFERIPGTPHTYHIKTLDPWIDRHVPITRTLLTHPTISAPSERLLALHCAIGHILYLSSAGWYIDRFLNDMEDGMVQEDGSTPLDLMLGLALR